MAIVTLGFGEIIRILFKFNPLTGGPQGILNVSSPTIKLPFLSIDFNSSTPFWYLIFFAAIIVAFVALRLNDSRLGRSWTAMREDEGVIEIASAGNFDLTFIFAHFRRDILNAETPVDFAFAASRHFGIQGHRFLAC